MGSSAKVNSEKSSLCVRDSSFPGVTFHDTQYSLSREFAETGDALALSGLHPKACETACKGMVSINVFSTKK